MSDLTKLTGLAAPLPSWAVKPNPMKPKMSVIHPMAVVQRLNEVFGIGGWNYKTTFISCDKAIQHTKNGEREIYISAVHGKLIVSAYGIDLEQFGGSTNDDKGDALKGGSTDALTKIASYLGIGAEIYMGHGNTKVVKEERTIESVLEDSRYDMEEKYGSSHDFGDDHQEPTKSNRR